LAGATAGVVRRGTVFGRITKVGAALGCAVARGTTPGRLGDCVEASDGADSWTVATSVLAIEAAVVDVLASLVGSSARSRLVLSGTWHPEVATNAIRAVARSANR
jgi:hypothetical protein